jgi:inosine-uridine nucleoside N-ribohydrolase
VSSASPARPRVIIDCDPGHDDAVAILLAACHLEVVGITTVGGNQSIEKVTANALKVLELAGLTRIPVAKGMAQPLLNQPRHAAAVHGETGLDGHLFPEPTTALDPRRAVEFIIDTLMTLGGMTIAALGPLTNVATALRLEPRLKERLTGISLMGGSAGIGNVTPVAEFNVWVDAEAARIVFESGVPITMCGLNLTHQATVGETELTRLRAIDNPVAQAVANLLGFYRETTMRGFGRPVAYLHDPCAIATLIDESLFEFESMRVDVETAGSFTYGMTVCDRRFAAAGPDAPALRRRASLPEPNARVAMRLDHERFFDLLYRTLESYPLS